MIHICKRYQGITSSQSTLTNIFLQQDTNVDEVEQEQIDAGTQKKLPFSVLWTKVMSKTI